MRKSTLKLEDNTRVMVSMHRMLVREKAEELYRLFSTEQPPGLFTKLLLDVADYLDAMRGKEEGELVDLYRARNRRFHKPIVKSMLAKTGIDPDSIADEGTTKAGVS